MYKIKQLPEDFKVKEISNVNNEENGQYAYYILKKINLTTLDALQILSKKFKIPLKNFGFAGNKDKNAITEQKISIFRGSKNFKNDKFNNIELTYIGNGKNPISLGNLEGNEFLIIIRNLDNQEIEKIKKIKNKKIIVPNLYGPQRFSKNNHLIGNALIKMEFKKAIDYILENNGQIEKQIKQYLEKNKSNYVEALRLIPLKTRKLFVHSYQSYLFNKIAGEYLKKNKKSKNIKIPLIGFNLEINSKRNAALKSIIKKTIVEEKINARDFIISQIPELTSEGGMRNLYFELKDLKILDIADDELNHKKKIKINFVLPKSCYATTAIEFIFQSS